MEAETTHFDGGCTCGYIRYRIISKPLFVQCCHCRWCQRESGSAFVMNGLIEMNRVQVLQGDVSIIDTPTKSEKGQQITRCPRCHIALWSQYALASQKLRFVRIGTLDNPDYLPPAMHVFTTTKQPWLILPPDVPAVPIYYSAKEYWPEDSLRRYDELLGRKAAK